MLNPTQNACLVPFCKYHGDFVCCSKLISSYSNQSRQACAIVTHSLVAQPSISLSMRMHAVTLEGLARCITAQMSLSNPGCSHFEPLQMCNRAYGTMITIHLCIQRSLCTLSIDNLLLFATTTFHNKCAPQALRTSRCLSKVYHLATCPT